ncbi:hypothetical protein [Streptomyces sp. 769]|nr:hypothetical protein [Streptomyces sp. 769]
MTGTHLLPIGALPHTRARTSPDAPEPADPQMAAAVATAGHHTSSPTGEL